MPLPIKKPIYCKHCGQLIKVAQFGDVLTPEDWLKLKTATKKQTCWKCKLFRKSNVD